MVFPLHDKRGKPPMLSSFIISLQTHVRRSFLFLCFFPITLSSFARNPVGQLPAGLFLCLFSVFQDSRVCFSTAIGHDFAEAPAHEVPQAALPIRECHPPPRHPLGADPRACLTHAIIKRRTPGAVPGSFPAVQERRFAGTSSAAHCMELSAVLRAIFCG